jgi:hypothetical protein
MSKLIRWNVPFSDAFYPSVTAIFETGTQLSRGKMEVTIQVSDGTRFRVESTSVLAFTCLDEGCAPKRWFSTVEIEQVETCAYECLESPWIKSYEGCQYDAHGRPVPLNHYLIYGGDNIVEFVCQHEPLVSRL